MKVRLPKNGMNLSKIQENMKKLQESREELEKKEYVGSAGGEMVKVKILGNLSMLEVKISDDIYKGDDKEMLQDLIVSAYNSAWKKACDEVEEISKSATSGLNIPGIPGLI